MPSRRRTTAAIRRPRVAGLSPNRTGESVDGTTTVTEVRPARHLDGPLSRRVRTGPEPADEVAPPAVDEPGPDEPGVDGVAIVDVDEPDVEERAVGKVDLSKPVGRRRLRRTEPEAEPSARSGLPARLRTVPVLTGVLVVLLALAVFFGVSTFALRNSPATANTALTDIGTTTEVATQLGDALEIVYSYDFARLDENERAAREVITTAFSTEFDRLFTQVRDLAPQQQAVVSATVTVSAVQEISGDRAVLVAFMDQQATTAATAEQAAAAGRLTVVGERVDGRWRIASVESH